MNKVEIKIKAMEIAAGMIELYDDFPVDNLDDCEQLSNELQAISDSLRHKAKKMKLKLLNEVKRREAITG